MPDSQKLNIVDEKGNIIGEDTRENIHRQGLLHREIHVWLYTPQGEIIFQHRAKDKDTYPDLLDASVGGHVEIGQDFEGAAIKELKEETGIRVEKKYLNFLQTKRGRFVNNTTNTINNVFWTIFTYQYHGKLDDLKVEHNKALGFESGQ